MFSRARFIGTALVCLPLLACGSRTLLELGADAGPALAEARDAGARADAGARGADAGPRDAGGQDAGGGLDAGRRDAGRRDAGGLDAGGLDAGAPDAGSRAIPRCNRPPPPPGIAGLDRARWALAADWVGTATTPAGWSNGPGWAARVSFRPDGTYAAANLDEPHRPPFYYGSPMPDPSLVYRLIGLAPSGEAEGRLTVRWSSGWTQEGNLERIAFDPTDTRVTFEFWNTWIRGRPRIGPVRYDLRCRR